jgi:hypothetical protein
MNGEKSSRYRYRADEFQFRKQSRSIWGPPLGGEEGSMVAAPHLVCLEQICASVPVLPIHHAVWLRIG